MPKAAGYVKEEVLKAIADHDLWVSIDETSNDTHGKMVCVVIGTLRPDDAELQKQFLIDLVHVTEWTDKQVIETFLGALVDLWGEDWVNHTHRIRLFVSDRGSQMVKAGTQLANDDLFPNMVYVSCLCHALSNVSNFIRGQFPDVSEFCTSARNMFKHSFDRKNQWNQLSNGLSLPPQMVQTRWASFTRCCEYHAKNFEVVKEVIPMIQVRENNSYAARAKALLEDPSLEHDIKLIASEFGIIGHTTTKLEGRNLSLVEVDVLMSEIEQALGKYRESDEGTDRRLHLIYEKFQEVKDRNTGFIALIDNMDDPAFHVYTFAPMNSAECERVFAALNDILADKRMSFKFPNLKHWTYVYWNSLQLGYRPVKLRSNL